MAGLKPSPLIIGLAGLPVIVAAVVLALAAGPGLSNFPTATFAAIGGLFYGLVGAAAVSGALRGPAIRMRATDARRRLKQTAESLGIPITDRLTSTGRPATVAAIATDGTCPLGLSPETCWQVSPFGKLNEPLCQPAIAAIDRVSRGVGRGRDLRASCVCPRGPQSVTFARQAT